MSDQVQIGLISLGLAIFTLISLLLVTKMAHRHEIRVMKMKEPIGVIEEVVHDERGITFRGRLFDSARGTQALSYIYGEPPKKQVKSDG